MSSIAFDVLVRRSLFPALFSLMILAPSAAAEVIVMRDDGDLGLTFTNVPDFAAVPAEEKRRVARSASPGQQGAKPASRRQLAPLVSAAAATHGLPEDLLAAVIEVESNFNVGAVSPKGAVGPMQLMPQTARYLGVTDLYDPAANIDAGARYLKNLMIRFGNNLHLALAAYNAGPGAVQRHGDIPPYAETQRYVPKVIQRYHSLQSGFSEWN